jgi:GDP-L-fucose synthase
MAKLAGLEMCWAYNRQYGTRYVCAMPTNLYGPGDTTTRRPATCCLRSSASSTKRAFAADGTVTLWGTGTPRRVLLHSDDAAEACMLLLIRRRGWSRDGSPRKPRPLVNVGSGGDVSIRELAELVREVVSCSAEILWDHGKPDGNAAQAPRHLENQRLGWRPRVDLREGIRAALADFIAREAR